MSRPDNLGLILKNLDSTKLKLLPAVMCSSDSTTRGRISSAFWEWRGRAAEQHCLTKCPNAKGRVRASLLTQQCLSWAPSSKPVCAQVQKNRQMTFQSETSVRPFPLTLIIKCLSTSVEFFSLRNHRSFLVEMRGSHKQRCTHHHADFASISHRNHPSGDMGDKKILYTAKETTLDPLLELP